MKPILKHCKRYVFRGVIAMIPIGVVTVTVLFIYNFIDKKVVALTNQYIGFRMPGLGLAILVIFLYLMGLIASNVIGRHLFILIGHILERIPLVNTMYQVGKQVSNTLSLPEKQIFRKALLVDCMKSGVWAIGFVTGDIIDKESGKLMHKVFIPTVPNPTTGFVVIVDDSQTIDPCWTVEETMKMVISGGIIGPHHLRRQL